MTTKVEKSIPVSVPEVSTESIPRVLVTGAGGFIGHHLVTSLKQLGYWVRGVDLHPPEYTAMDADEFELRDLRRFDECLLATRGIDHVYALAADMGGMGFISANHATILRNNALINIHTLEAARMNGVSRYLFSSSACVYPEYRQNDANVEPLKEQEAYPAQPQDAYGWEKLFSERLCIYYRDDYDIEAVTDGEAALAANDSGGWFAARGDLFITGPTGTNVSGYVMPMFHSQTAIEAALELQQKHGFDASDVNRALGADLSDPDLAASAFSNVADEMALKVCDDAVMVMGGVGC